MNQKNKYRIVKDRYAGFEVQTKKWWFPISWFQCSKSPYLSNTHLTVDKAEEYIRKRKIKDA